MRHALDSFVSLLASFLWAEGSATAQEIEHIFRGTHHFDGPAAHSTQDHRPMLSGRFLRRREERFVHDRRACAKTACRSRPWLSGSASLRACRCGERGSRPFVAPVRVSTKYRLCYRWCDVKSFSPSGGGRAGSSSSRVHIGTYDTQRNTHRYRQFPRSDGTARATYMPV